MSATRLLDSLGRCALRMDNRLAWLERSIDCRQSFPVVVLLLAVASSLFTW